MELCHLSSVWDVGWRLASGYPVAPRCPAEIPRLRNKSDAWTFLKDFITMDSGLTNSPPQPGMPSISSHSSPTASAGLIAATRVRPRGAGRWLGDVPCSAAFLIRRSTTRKSRRPSGDAFVQNCIFTALRFEAPCVWCGVRRVELAFVAAHLCASCQILCM